MTLDELFFRAIQEHPVPLQEAAIRELRERSMSLDIYVWLARRFHSLTKPTPISWTAVFAEFGAGHAEVSHFEARFMAALAAAVAAYSQSQVDIGDAGVTLHPYRPPIARLTAQSLLVA